MAPVRRGLRRRFCQAFSLASASLQLVPSSPVETTAAMRRSSSAEPVTAASPWPMKALRRKTSRPAPVSASPAVGPVSPGTGSAVPVYTALNSFIGDEAPRDVRVRLISRPPNSMSIVPDIGLPDQGW